MPNGDEVRAIYEAFYREYYSRKLPPMSAQEKERRITTDVQQAVELALRQPNARQRAIEIARGWDRGVVRRIAPQIASQFDAEDRRKGVLGQEEEITRAAGLPPPSELARPYAAEPAAGPPALWPPEAPKPIPSAPVPTPLEEVERQIAELEAQLGRPLTDAERYRILTNLPAEPDEGGQLPADIRTYQWLLDNVGPEAAQAYLNRMTGAGAGAAAPQWRPGEYGLEQERLGLSREQVAIQRAAQEWEKQQEELRLVEQRAEERQRILEARTQMGLGAAGNLGQMGQTAMGQAVQAAPYAIPPGMEYRPGYQPGGPAQQLTEYAGGQFTPQKAEGVTINIGAPVQALSGVVGQLMNMLQQQSRRF